MENDTDQPCNMCRGAISLSTTWIKQSKFYVWTIYNFLRIACFSIISHLCIENKRVFRWAAQKIQISLWVALNVHWSRTGLASICIPAPSFFISLTFALNQVIFLIVDIGKWVFLQHCIAMYCSFKKCDTAIIKKLVWKNMQEPTLIPLNCSCTEWRVIVAISKFWLHCFDFRENHRNDKLNMEHLLESWIRSFQWCQNGSGILTVLSKWPWLQWWI